MNNRCNSCSACKRGYESLCPAGLLSGFSTDGTFQQYALIEGAEAIRIPESVDMAEAAPILCAVSGDTTDNLYGAAIASGHDCLPSTA